MKAIEVINLEKKFLASEGTVQALNHINFSIEKGEFWGIVGESGSGKSTLLNILGTLDSPTSGKVLIDGKDPFSFKDKDISLFRNKHIGFVFQQNNLLPEFSALENVMIPALISSTPYSKALNKAKELLEKVNLSTRIKHFPSQLSGGEQQRVAVARALINNPVVLLADEPSGNLDSKNAQNVHNLFSKLNQDLQVTIILVTHNQEFSALIPHKIVLKDGMIQEKYN